MQKILKMENLLRYLVTQNGSDLHLVPGQIPKIRVQGQLINLNYMPLKANQITSLLDEMEPSSEAMGLLYDNKSTDFSYTNQEGNTFRVNVSECVLGYKITLRWVRPEIPSLDSLGYTPNLFEDVCKLKHGLVLITGTTNSGKSTSIAAMIQDIINKRSVNLITLEHPIEYTFYSHTSVIEQREFLKHFLSWDKAIEDSLRSDPDIIYIGEMRDPSTIKAGLLASNTGHLVFATLHNNTIESAKERMSLVFEPHERPMIEQVIKDNLRCIVAQELVYNPNIKKLELKYECQKYFGTENFESNRR